MKIEDNSVKARSLLNGILWQLGGSWGTRIGSLVVFAVLARLLDPVAMGVVGYVLGVLAIVLVGADLALAEYLVYRQDASDDVASAIWLTQILASVVLAVGLCLLAILWPELVAPSEVDRRMVFAAAASMPFMAAVKVPEALLRRDVGAFRLLATRVFWVTFIGAAVAIPLAWMGAAGWSLIAKHWAETLASLALFFPRGAWRPNLRAGLAPAGVVIRRSWGLMGSRILNVLAQRLDTFIIGRLIGMHELGLYTVAQKLFQVLHGLILGSVYSVVNSRIGSLREQRAELQRFALVAVVGTGIATSAVYLLGVALGQPVLEVFFGPKWFAGWPLLQVFLLGALATSLLQTTLSAYLCFAQQDNGMAITLCGLDVALTGLLYVWLAPLGVQAIVLAWAAKSLLLGGLWWWRSLVLLELSAYVWLRTIAPNAVVVVLALLVWQGSAWVADLSSWPWPNWAGSLVLIATYLVGMGWMALQFRADLSSVYAELRR